MVSIRVKILLIVIPLIFVSMALITVLSVGFAQNGITKVAKEFLGFKINQIIQKAETENDNLRDITSNDNQKYEEFLNAVKEVVKQYSLSITKKDIESVIAVDSEGIVRMSTDQLLIVDTEVDFITQMTDKKKGWINFKVEGLEKVGFYRYFEDWDWYILLSVYSKMFYKDANQILSNSIIILIISMLAAVLLLLFFIYYMFRPMQIIISTMNDIIKMNDMSKRVPILYNDEIGELAFTFNNMLSELDNAYNQIKEYAYQSVLAQKKEERIKNMFQKYVPQDVVDDIVHNPTRALEGKDKNVTVLFSDIRDFTTISESMPPDTLVKSLNRYFTVMVDIIYSRRGVIDKYIGDAIMAIFGAPKEYGDDIQQGVLAGLEMLEQLDKFNSKQRELKLREFKIGIGINYGPVTVGNIGTSQKMDYTVIGDAVNLASRLEGLTKEYKTPIIVSEDTKRATKNYFYFREIDRVTVKGKTEPVKIWQPARKLRNIEKKGWQLYNKAVQLFLKKNWEESEKIFIEVLEILKDDFLSIYYIEQIKQFKIKPPDKDWDGTIKMTHK